MKRKKLVIFKIRHSPLYHASLVSINIKRNVRQLLFHRTNHHNFDIISLYNYYTEQGFVYTTAAIYIITQSWTTIVAKKALLTFVSVLTSRKTVYIRQYIFVQKEYYYYTHTILRLYYLFFTPLCDLGGGW